MAFRIIVFLAAAAMTVGAAQAPMLTPNEADIPKPVPGEISLAGSAAPDISRFLNVRTAVAPSLSPDGTRLTFLTGITGTPQLWVVHSRGGWPDQLTFGESVTFHEWSPSGEWVVYGSDRGGNEREAITSSLPMARRSANCCRRQKPFASLAGLRATASGSRTQPPSETATTSTSI